MQTRSVIDDSAAIMPILETRKKARCIQTRSVIHDTADIMPILKTIMAQLVACGGIQGFTKFRWCHEDRPPGHKTASLPLICSEILNAHIACTDQNA